MSTTTTFEDDVEEKHSVLLEGPKPSPSRPWFRSMPSVSYTSSFQSRERSTYPPQAHVPILFVITMFPVSTALVVIAFFTLPFSFSWPQNLADLAQLGRELHGYSQSGPGALVHVFSVISAVTIWMHAWSIPGSVLWVSRTTLISFFRAHDVRSQKTKECPRRRSIFAPFGNAASRRTYNGRVNFSNASLRSSISLYHTFSPASIGLGPQYF